MIAKITGGLAGGAAGAAGAYAAVDATLDNARKSTDAAKADWARWKRKLDAEFPDRKLQTPGDHARLERFLKANPPPSFVTVEHENYNRIAIRSLGAVPGEENTAYGMGLLGGIGGVGIGFAGQFVQGGGPVREAVRTAALAGGAVLGLGMFGGMFAVPTLYGVSREIEETEFQGH